MMKEWMELLLSDNFFFIRSQLFKQISLDVKLSLGFAISFPFKIY
jgi:hypothetical protein